MAANRIEAASASANAEAAKSGPSAEAAPANNAAAAPAAGGGLKAWLPLAAAVVTMPLLAYATTTFLILPKLQRSVAAAPAAAAEATAPKAETAEQGSGEGAADAKGKEGGATKTKTFAQLNKVLVNVAGTMGTRFLVVNITVVSKKGTFEQNFKDNEPELRHVAIGCLSSKTITDLEKPGAKNIIRSELTSLFNSVIGGGMVEEIFFTEFAIQ